MPEEISHLYGRERPVALVREFMTRPDINGVPTSRRVPIVMVTGPRGCGKTALLDELASEFTGKVPYARIDCESLDATEPWDVLTLLVFEFNRLAGRYRRVPFPRFVAARVVMAENLSLTSDERAREEAMAAIQRHRKIDRLRQFLGNLVTRLVQALAGPGAPRQVADAASYTPGLLLKGLVKFRRGRRLVFGEGVDWYGENAIDELVQLNRLTQPGAGDEGKRGAAELLWKAFLADLRAAFGSGRGSREWSLNCPVLLDDIDSELGRTLLDGLVHARRQHAVHRPHELDPLTVVATTAGAEVPWKADIPSAEEASYDDYLDRMRVQDRDWYPVSLRNLTFEEIVEMVSSVGGAWRREGRHVAGSVYRLTLGHPGATAELVKAMGRNTESTVPLRTLLETTSSSRLSERPGTVEDRILLGLRGSLPNDTPDPLVVYSAARDVADADLLARNSGLTTPLRDDNEPAVPLQLQTTDVFSTPATMLPVLRHLLLRRLADQPERWSAVHRWLRENSTKSMSTGMYHALATRDVAAVTTWLTERLQDTDLNVSDWLTDLYSITSAPTDIHDNGTPNGVLDAVGWIGPRKGADGALAKLVVALWIANDPLSGVDRGALYDGARLDLQEVAKSAPKVEHDLRNEARWLAAVAKVPNDAAIVAGIRPPKDRNAPSTQSRLIDDREKVSFRPPMFRKARTHRRWKIGTAVGTAAALVAALVVWQWPSAPGQCGPDLTRLADECVGVSDGSFVFDENNLAAVEKMIHAENQAVESQNHVTLALLTPLTPTDTGSVTPERVRAQLEGAYIAQRAANATHEPKIKLLLANPGSRQQGWQHVVNELQELVAAPDNLVGVIGLVPSTRITQEIMRALAAMDLPMVGTLVTAADINKVVRPDGTATYVQGFTRVSPTTRNQVTALAEYLGTTPRRAMLLYDDDEENLFASSLRDEFEAASAASDGRLSITVLNRYDTEADLDNQFGAINGDLCGDGAPDTVLYAGRAALLDSLIRNLRDRSCARDRPITLVTGSDASILKRPGYPEPRPDQAKLSVLYTPAADPDALRTAGVPEFETFAAAFTGAGFAEADLRDGWAIITHDALRMTSEAIRRAAPSGLPSRETVRFQINRTARERNQVRGAQGPFRLHPETGDADGLHVPVIEVSSEWTFTIKAVCGIDSTHNPVVQCQSSQG